MRKPFVAGNWKMNMDSQTGVELAKGVASGVTGDSVTVAVIPPFVYLPAVGQAIASSNVALGAQDVYFEEKGAFTGEISTAMLKDVGCTYVLCGHSERRHVLGESDEIVNKKLLASLAGGLLAILCVGELLEERDGGQTEQVVERQVRAGLAGVDADMLASVTIAYEPVWAIGTGRTATREQAQEVHACIRKLLVAMYDEAKAAEMRILYGGSVKADNAKELMSEADVDGCLVGGASLKVADFTQIIQAVV